MLKQWIVFFSFIFLLLVVFVQSQSLSLSFYVLFPTLLFPVYYYYDQQKRDGYFLITMGMCLLLYLYMGFYLKQHQWDLLSNLELGLAETLPQRRLKGRKAKTILRQW